MRFSVFPMTKVASVKASVRSRRTPRTEKHDAEKNEAAQKGEESAPQGAVSLVRPWLATHYQDMSFNR